MRVIIYFIICFILCSCGSSKETPQYSGGLIVGDSVMAGLPLTNYKGVDMVNQAVGGTHCEDSVEVLIDAGPKKLVVLGCGHNGNNLDEDLVALKLAIDWCNINCNKLIIVNVNPVYIRPSRADKIAAINVWLDKQLIEIIDFYTWSDSRQNSFIFKDGLHPTNEGYVEMINDLFLP